MCWRLRFAAMGLLLTPAIVGGLGAARDPGAPSDGAWRGRIAPGIAESEYFFSETSGGGWSAPNRTHGLRALPDASGIEIVSRTRGPEERDGGWRLRLELTAWGREGSLRPAGPAETRAHQGRAELERPALTEWYLNDRRGLEQGFTLPAPPGDVATEQAPEAPLVLEMRLEGGLGAYPDPDGGSILFRTGRGDAVLRYGDLAVRDAVGGEVACRLRVQPGRLRILIEDRGAAYPLTVDPLMTSPVWSVGSDQAGAALGVSVAAAGDVNGDGYGDVIVGASAYDNGAADEGRAFVYLGSPAGPASTPAWTAESNQAGALFGVSVSAAGDVDGDGFGDVIVGAHGYDNGQVNEGRAFLFRGSASGLAAAPAWTAEGDQAGALFGVSVSAAGDVNADGFGDVVVGAQGYDGGQVDEGKAFVFHGSASGLSATPAWTAEGDQADAFFGASVAAAGDVNADGYGDVIVGAYAFDGGQTDEGRAFVFLGSASGLSSSAIWTAESDQAGASFGYPVAAAGDLNGDGYGDVAVGAFSYDGSLVNEGRAYVYHGSSTGPATAPSWTAEGGQADSQYGVSVAAAGDVNGDGYADLIVGAPGLDDPEVGEGRALVYLGSAAGLPPGAVWTVEGDQAGAFLGASAAAAGDVNGDGFGDVLVGAWGYDDGQVDEGVALLYPGSGSGPSAAASWRGQAGQAGAEFSRSVAPAGDVNGDGYSDVIVGAHGFDNGQVNEGRAFVYHGSASGLGPAPAWTAEGDQAGAAFGWSVATAGDVNGDGYSDVVVGARLYDNGQTDEGRAFVYHGSAAGLSATPAWTAESDQAGAAFGWSVAAAGDVNGDGYSDVIVGARSYGNGQGLEGRAFVYLGSPAGLSSTPAWTAESDQVGALFGVSVAGAGDVNADGYSDVIVGAESFDNGQTDEGRVFVYLGSAGGLGASPAWTAESDQAGAAFGTAVAGAGDVDADGYSDVIVGAWAYDNGQTNEGRAFVYHGSAAGLGASPAWTAESDQAVAAFGISVAAAGDVNGDGYGDVVVGANGYDNGQTEEGRAFVHLGSASGLAASAVWTAEADVAAAFFGASVAPAGDVNADGFGDVIVGSPIYNDGVGQEGRAWAFFGNGGDGLERLPRQARADDTAPLHILGLSHGDSFRLKAWVRTPAGRGRARLLWEVKPLGTPFDGTGLGDGGVVDTGAPSGSGSALDFEDVAGGLADGTVYRWRLRVASDSPLFPRSPWFSIPGNGPTEADLRANACRDADGDGFGSPGEASCPGGAGTDCDDRNPQVFAVPVEVSDVGVETIPGGHRFVWLDQGPSAGAGTVYDAFAGLVSALAPAGDFSTGACFQENRAAAHLDDTGPDPAPGDVRYFIFRAQNACPGGTGTYGTPNRDATAALGPAPCD